MNAKRGRQRDEPLTGFVRFRLEEWARNMPAGESMKSLAEAAGIAASGITQVRAGDLGVSSGTIHGYAKLLGFPSARALRNAAEDWWESVGRHAVAARGVQPEPTVEKPDRYAVMPLVRAAAKSDRIPEEFVERFAAGLDFDEQPSFSQLYDLLKSTWQATRGKTGRAPTGPADF